MILHKFSNTKTGRRTGEAKQMKRTMTWGDRAHGNLTFPHVRSVMGKNIVFDLGWNYSQNHLFFKLNSRPFIGIAGRAYATSFCYRVLHRLASQHKNILGTAHLFPDFLELCAMEESAVGIFRFVKTMRCCPCFVFALGPLFTVCVRNMWRLMTLWSWCSSVHIHFYSHFYFQFQFRIVKERKKRYSVLFL